MVKAASEFSLISLRCAMALPGSRSVVVPSTVATVVFTQTIPGDGPVLVLDVVDTEENKGWVVRHGERENGGSVLTRVRGFAEYLRTFR